MYLVKRLLVCDPGYYLSGNRCYPESSWYWWGRWVLTAALILGVIAILLLLGCVSARRRRRQGMAPLYGTGWMGPKYTGPPYPGNPQGYYQQGPYQQGPYQGYNNQQAPPPKYTPNGYSDPNQTGGIQPPQNIYAMHSTSTPDSRPEEGVYSPPPGPPPAK